MKDLLAQADNEGGQHEDITSEVRGLNMAAHTNEQITDYFNFDDSEDFQHIRKDTTLNYESQQ